MSQPARKQAERTASIRPIRPPALTAKHLDLDDQVAALCDQDAVLAKQLEELRSSTRASADDLAAQIARAEGGADLALKVATTCQNSLGRHEKRLDVHRTVLLDHQARLRDDEAQLRFLSLKLETVRLAVEDNHLLAASQSEIERLEEQIRLIEARENATHGLTAGLSEQVAHLATEIRRLQQPQPRTQVPAPAPIRRRRVEKPSEGSFFLRVACGAVSVAFLAALVYTVLPH